MPGYEQMVRRQRVLAEFGAFAMGCNDLNEILTEACRLVAAALGTDRAKVLEIQSGGQFLFVCAGVGWRPDIVGQHRMPMSKQSSETYSITQGRPVITRDTRTEDRFEVADFMKRAGVIAFVNVPIRVPGGGAYGLLQVDSTEPRDFGENDIEFLETYSTILGPVIDRLLKLRELRSSEERFRLTVEQVLDYAIFVTDQDGCITDWLPGAQAVFGWSPQEAVGQSASMLFTPEDRERGEPEEELCRARRDGFAPNVRWHLRKDGSRVFIEGSVRVLRDGGTAPTGFLKIGQDVTKRRADEQQLRDNEDWLRTLMEGVPQLNWRSRPDGHWTWASPQWLEYTGQSQAESHSLGWLDVTHPEDRGRVMRAWDEAAAIGRLDVESRVRRASDGAWRWHQTRSVPVRHPPHSGPENGVHDWLGTSTDIDDLKILQGEQRVLVAELQHRTRNLLAVVRNVARRSIPPSLGREEYDARLAAIGRVQGFLARTTAYTVSLHELVQAELRAVGDVASPRVTVAGPAVELPGEGIQPIALALHELATNAMKYGALAPANPAARLCITWDVGGEAQPGLCLTWRESAVTMPSGPPDRLGYGSELITQALPYQLRAETLFEFTPDGVHCSITLPAGTFRSTGGAAM